MTLTAVWGSSGSGKSTVALALGAVLAKRGEDTLVIGTDACTPSLALYLPNHTSLTPNHSIGGLLELTDPTEGSLKDRIHQHPKSDRLFFMGHVSGEAPAISCKPPERGAVTGLVHLLQASPFRHVLLDCASNPAFDTLTLYALEAAAVVLQVLTPNVKGCEFRKAQLSWMGTGDVFHPERHIKVSNLAYPFSPREEAAALCGGFEISLPYARQAAERMAAGELLAGFTDLDAIRFETGICQLAEYLKGGDRHA